MNKDFKIDKIMNTTFFKVFCVLDSLIGIISAFFSENNVLKVIFIVTVFIMFIVGCFLAFRYKKFIDADKKNMELSEEISKKNSRIDLLEQNIHNGVKYTNNEVVVTLDRNKKLYRFEFIKEFEIISDNAPKWYYAQFYANKILKDKKMSKEYYKDNVIKWDDLKVRATVSYLHPGSREFTNPVNLVIDNITDENNYIPFNIQYTTFRGRRTLNMKKGTKVKLKYCYNVPIHLWGSYLNRTISYFGEPAVVKLKYDIGAEFDIKVSSLSGVGGAPLDTEDYGMYKDEENEYIVRTITLQSQPFAKYRIWWDSEKYFENDKTTEDTADNSQLTNY